MPACVTLSNFQICSIWTLRFSFIIYKSTPHLCLNSVSLVQHYNGFTTYWLQDSSHLVFAVRTPIVRPTKNISYSEENCAPMTMICSQRHCNAFVVWSSYEATQANSRGICRPVRDNLLSNCVSRLHWKQQYIADILWYNLTNNQYSTEAYIVPALLTNHIDCMPDIIYLRYQTFRTVALRFDFIGKLYPAYSPCRWTINYTYFSSS